MIAPGEQHWNWRGDQVGYSGLHLWIRRVRPLPEACEHCGATDRKLEWANHSGEYLREVDDWLALCRFCHRAYDRPATCKRGHPKTPENTTKTNKGCRICLNVAKRAYAARQRQLARRP